MITWENYEEYMMMHADGELQAAEVRELMAFVNKHPRLKSELEDMRRVKLVADSSVVYAYKQSLMKEAPARRIAFPAWKQYTVAAGIAAMLLAAFFVLRNTTPGANETVAHNETHVVPHLEKKEPPVVAEQHDEKEVTAGVQPARGEKAVNTVREQKAVQQDKVNAPAAARDIPVPAAIPEQAVALPLAEVKEIVTTPEAVSMAVTRNIPQYAPVTTPENKKQSLWDKLPIDGTKKKELEEIAGKLKKATEGDKLSIKVERNRLILSF